MRRERSIERCAAIVFMLFAVLSDVVLKNGVTAQYYDHPGMDESVNEEFKSRVEENAMTERLKRGRDLSTSFIPMETRYTDPSLNHTIGKIRVSFVFDLLDDIVDDRNASTSEQMDPGMCRYVGQSVNPCSYEGSGSCTYTCEAEDVVTDAMVTIVKEYAQWLETYLEDKLFVLTRDESIVMDTNSKRNYNWDKGGTRTDTSSSFQHNVTDVVVVMTLHKSENGVAGYAGCGMRDSLNRCIVGYFNWCPNQLDTVNRLSPDVIQGERHTFLHEVLHVLGCCSGDYFLDTNGNSVTADMTDQQYAPATAGLETFDKTVRFFHSPKVLATAREQWGCESITGVPLEDVPLGAGSHWEARVMGAEVMAYGSSSGESYMSDLTWAYLEDSGHYIVARNYKTGDQFTANNNNYLDNYTYAVGGRLLEATGSGWTQGTISLIAEFFGFASEKEDGEAVVRSPGYLRWGRKRGCDFFQGLPKDTWENFYMDCTTQNEGGCTADRRMSATCIHREWGSSGYSVNQPYTCRESGQCTSNSANPNLPTKMRTFDSANTGGYNDAMDYVPAMVGYWNCLDEKPLSTSTSRVVGNQSLDFSSIFNVLATDLDKFGGQQHGADSRCFESTLREFGSVLAFSMEKYGLCYVSNCYSADYLQVGIRGRDGGTDWYGCPKKGGTMYIAGFSGSITCPDPSVFCAQEDITGVFHTEAENWAAWVIIGIVAGIPALIVLILCCFKKPRDKCTLCTKVLCGFELDPDERLAHERSRARRKVRTQNMFGIESTNTTRQLAAIDSRAMRVFRYKVNRALVRRHTCNSRTLFYINTVWQLVGFCIFLFGLIAIGNYPEGFKNCAPLCITASIFVIGISGLGCSGLTSGRPTLKLLLYFYISLFMSIILGIFVAVYLADTDSMDDVADQQWLTYRLYFPDSYHSLDRGEAMDKLENFLGFNPSYLFIGIVSFMGMSVVVGTYCAGAVLTFKNLMQNLFMIFNLVVVFSFGITSIVYGAQGLEIDGLFEVYIYAIVICFGIYLVGIVTIGIWGDWTKSERMMMTYHVTSLIGSFGALTVAVSIYAQESDIRSRIDDLDDDEKAKLAEIMGAEASSDEDLTSTIMAVFILYATLSIAAAITMAALSFCSRYIVALHEARKKIISDWARRCREAERRGVSAPIAPDVSFANVISQPSFSMRDGDDLDIGIARKVDEIDVGISPDPLPRAMAVDMGDMDAMEFPPPPSSPMAGEFEVPSVRPHPLPPVGPRPPPRNSASQGDLQGSLPVADILDADRIHSI